MSKVDISRTAMESKLGCNFCSADMSEENPTHEDWCEKIARKIYRRFNSTFREIYNVIELSLDDKRTETAKSLIGNTIMETRNDCTNIVVNYFVKDRVEPIRKL